MLSLCSGYKQQIMLNLFIYLFTAGTISRERGLCLLWIFYHEIRLETAELINQVVLKQNDNKSR